MENLEFGLTLLVMKVLEIWCAEYDAEWKMLKQKAMKNMKKKIEKNQIDLNVEKVVKHFNL